MTNNQHLVTEEYAVPKFEDNVPGAWHVNEECITCGVCAEAAPENFRLSGDGDHNIVFKQPSSPEELEQAKEAMEECPVEAIICAE